MAASDVAPWEQNWSAPASEKAPWEQNWSSAPDPTRSGDLWKPSRHAITGGNYGGFTTHWVDPDYYLKNRAPLGEKAKDSPEWRSLEKSMNAGEEMDEAPTLVYGKGGKVEEDQSDGRHRALWAKEHGVTQIPVRVKGDAPEDFPAEPIPVEGRSLPQRIGDWWKSSPPAIEASADISKRVREMYEGSPEQKAGMSFFAFGNKNQEARDLLHSDPMLGAFAPGEGLAASRLPTMAARAATEPGAAEAMRAGYVLPPHLQGGQGVAKEYLSGLAGPVPLEKRAMRQDQAVTNALAKDEIGLPKDKPITKNALAKYRNDEGKAYENIKSSPEVLAKLPKLDIDKDPHFLNDVIKIGHEDVGAAQSQFPGLLDKPDIDALKDKLLTTQDVTPKGVVELVKRLRNESSRGIKSAVDSERELGHAKRDAAEALDNLLERELNRVGLGHLAKDYNEARVNIAKSYTLKSALNEATGNIDPQVLGRLYKRGVPLSGNLEKIAKAANAFPSVVKLPERGSRYRQFNALDTVIPMVGAVSEAMSGGIGLKALMPILAGAAVRPGLRELMLRNPKAFQPKSAVGGNALRYTLPLMQQQGQEE